MSWWYAVNNEKLGPVDQAALLALYREQKIAAGTLVWTKGMADWQTFGSVEALQAQLAAGAGARWHRQPYRACWRGCFHRGAECGLPGRHGQVNQHITPLQVDLTDHANLPTWVAPLGAQP